MVDVVNDSFGRGTCDEPVHPELFFVATNYYVGHCIAGRVEVFPVPFVFYKTGVPAVVDNGV